VKIVDWLRKYGIHAYVIMFFFILFFRYKNIDIVRVPFFLFLGWQWWKKELSLKFFVDPISASILVLVLTALISNIINGIPLDKIVRLINWFFPYFLGKYLVLKCPEIKFDNLLLYLLFPATLFAMVGLLGSLFGWETLFGQELFQGERYKFTIRKINWSGFCVGTTLVLSLYFFIRQKPSWRYGYLFPIVCWIVVFASLFLIKERKTITMVVAIIMMVLLFYRQYGVVIVALIAVGIILVSVPIPQRYQPEQWVYSTSIQIRLNGLESAIGLFKKKPLIGHGYPSFRHVHKAYNEEHLDQMRFKKYHFLKFAHNMNLNALVEFGIVGFFALNFIFFYCWRFYKYRYSGRPLFILGVAVVFFYSTMQVSGLVHASLRSDLVFLVFGLYLAMQNRHASRRSALTAEPQPKDALKLSGN